MKIEIPAVPLAERSRPKSIDEFKGQDHLLGEGKPLRMMIDNDTVSSVVLWGPPGTGKTTIAKIISEKTNSEFFQINAVSSGVKEIRSIIEKSKENKLFHKRTILFIDEIHRFNKAQQDALLSSVESGDIILIGATTENPSFEVIPALRSRVKIYTLNSLTEDNLREIIEDSIRTDLFLSTLNIKSVDSDFMIYASGGDARILLNLLESAIIHEIKKDEIIVSKELIEEILQRKNIFYDKDGEEHYNVISAFIKSMRGSDPDAALYWMARMLEGGEDPIFIARRMLVLSSEDIGNASPNALLIAQATFSAVEKVGMPEGRIILAQCAVYLASQPKSNSSYMGIEKALAFVRNNKNFPVPLKLRNAPTSLMKNLNYGKDYRYAHDFDNHFIIDNFLPEEMKGMQFYIPSENGQEKNIKERLKQLWKDFKKY
ncbi:MAG: replication-associated recombination protein A [Melioribacteraceae bacterium]|nr:replication-associated recombination protein A [Melioribacteraceae bacterium]